MLTKLPVLIFIVVLSFVVMCRPSPGALAGAVLMGIAGLSMAADMSSRSAGIRRFAVRNNLFAYGLGLIVALLGAVLNCAPQPVALPDPAFARQAMAYLAVNLAALLFVTLTAWMHIASRAVAVRSNQRIAQRPRLTQACYSPPATSHGMHASRFKIAV